MHNILKIALRNLLRYKRRTLFTSLLITIGVVAVLLFVSMSGAFKSMMIGQITDSMLGHLQVHKRGYVASIDNLPLHLNLGPTDMQAIETALDALDEVEAYSPRIKFGGMFSNFEETTNVSLERGRSCKGDPGGAPSAEADSAGGSISHPAQPR